MTSEERDAERIRMLTAMVAMTADPHRFVDIVGGCGSVPEAVTAITSAYSIDAPTARALLGSSATIFTRDRSEGISAELAEMLGTSTNPAAE